MAYLYLGKEPKNKPGELAGNGQEGASRVPHPLSFVTRGANKLECLWHVRDSE